MGSRDGNDIKEKKNMAVCNLIGRRRYQKKMRINGSLLQFKRAYITFFVRILIEMNVNICNKLNIF